MRKIPARAVSAAAAAAVVLAGCGGGEDGGAPAPAAPAPAAPAAPADTASAAVPFDRAFIDGMVPHHEQAIEMAEAAKAAGLASPELVEIADGVIATQQDEIDQMRAWRAEWFGSPEVDPSGAAPLGLSMQQMGMEHDPRTMMGSDDVDAAFAAAMVDHHQGAIRMAELALDRGQHPEIRSMAQRIIEAQQGEIDVMMGHVGMHHGG